MKLSGNGLFELLKYASMFTINKYQSLIILSAVLAGLALGQLTVFSENAELFIVPFLMLMLFSLFIHISLKDILKSLLNVKFLSANVVINFLWTPPLAYFIGYLFLQNELSLWIGLVMLLVTPCKDWYLIFTGIAKGNVPLSASVLPLNLILQVILLPVYLLLFFGQTGSIDSGILIESILLVLAIPFLLAQIIKFLFGGVEGKSVFKSIIMPFLENS